MERFAKIFVIDDSRMTQQLVMSHLQTLRVEIIQVYSSIDALDKVKRQKPDVILLDVNMPEMSGFDLCRRIKSEPELHDIPIIFLTAKDEIIDKVKGFDLGAADYITKPFEPVELRMRVNVHLKTKHLIDLLAKEARLDNLTGLYNRLYFDERIEQEIHRSIREFKIAAIMFIDVDDFKHINDTLGHPVGDQVLQRISELILSVSRITDVVCRYGGDEFCMILCNTDKNEAALVAKRIITTIENDHELKKTVQQLVTVSIGIATTGLDTGIDIQQIVVSADQALYDSKRIGKNCVSIAK
ncbi:Response regulator PleD [Poriferisphaera corsica]|uniref:diguanylate cyclase n=1 Tax=Poriferisphaera corsica TaxID=2528020 RepID=A0A517YPG8_9BACT|nr:diguanylate cyclase [Poriferisphaera corsica]QDU32113.1 Response regulator PleD [Poriferisphaera corsica]